MAPTDRCGYGVGFLAGGVKDQVAAVGSYDWAGFYSTGFGVDPEKKRVCVLMTQLFPSDHLILYPAFIKLAYAVTK
jgi:CubicO group peptidase (beta-lactamase class C family)